MPSHTLAEQEKAANIAFLQAITKAVTPKPQGIFEQILSGLGGGVAIGTGISQLTNPPTTTIRRDVPAAGATELSSLARLNALQGGLLSDVGYRETPGAAGQTRLTDVGIPQTALQARGGQIGGQVGRLLGGGGRLSPQGRQGLISQLQGRMGAGGSGGTGQAGLGLGNTFAGTATGAGFTSPITGRQGGSSGGGGLGLPAALGTLGALAPILAPYLKNLLGLSTAATGAAGTTGTAASTAAPISGTPSTSPTAGPPAATPNLPTIPNVAPSFESLASPFETEQDLIDAGIIPPRTPPTGPILSPNPIQETPLPNPFDIDFRGSMPPGIFAPTDLDLIGSMPPMPSPIVAPTDADLIGSMPPTPGGDFLGTVLPIIGLGTGIAGLANAQTSGQRAASGVSTAASGLSLASKIPAVASAIPALSSIAPFLGPLSLGLGVANAFGVFDPSRSETSPQRRSAAANEAIRMAEGISGFIPAPERDIILQAALTTEGSQRFEMLVPRLSTSALIAGITRGLQKMKLEGATLEGHVAAWEDAMNSSGAVELVRRGINVEAILNRLGFSSRAADVQLNKDELMLQPDSGIDHVRYAQEIGPERLARAGFELRELDGELNVMPIPGEGMPE